MPYWKKKKNKKRWYNSYVITRGKCQLTVSWLTAAAATKLGRLLWRETDRFWRAEGSDGIKHGDRLARNRASKQWNTCPIFFSLWGETDRFWRAEGSDVIKHDNQFPNDWSSFGNEEILSRFSLLQFSSVHYIIIVSLAHTPDRIPRRKANPDPTFTRTSYIFPALGEGYTTPPPHKP